VLAERANRQPVKRLGQSPAPNEFIGDIEGDVLIRRQIVRFQIAHQGRQTLGLHPFPFGDGDMSIDFVCDVEARTNDKNCDLADVAGPFRGNLTVAAKPSSGSDRVHEISTTPIG
jgi:hypothetical protein